MWYEIRLEPDDDGTFLVTAGRLIASTGNTVFA